MRPTSPRVLRTLLLTLVLSLVSPIIYSAPAHATSSNPACAPTSTTVNGKTVLEFDEPNAGDSNTTGGNVGYTCDWTVPANVYNVTVVVVGGGGSGGYGNQAGGGGGGEVFYTNNGYSTTPSGTIPIVIGAGGAAVALNGGNNPGNTGANSSFNGISVHGGGGGGSGSPGTADAAPNRGLTGGSSGGGDRFAQSVPATSSSLNGWTSLVNIGGRGAGLQANPLANAESTTAGPGGCYAYGAGGGGGGAMSAGTNATASCTGNSASDVITVSAGNGGAGAYLLGYCLGGGGGSVAYSGVAAGKNLATTTNETGSSPTQCIDPTTSQSVSGTHSGGYVSNGINPQAAVANTGGGGPAGTDGTALRGSSGVVIISYDPTFPPVPPTIDVQPQSKTVTAATLDSVSVTAHVNDGGTLSYSWYYKTPGSTSFSPITCVTSCAFNYNVTDSGTVYKVQITNTKSSRTTSVWSNLATISVTRRVPDLVLQYPNSNTAVFYPGETLTARYFFTASDGAASLTSLSNASICTVNGTTAVVSLFGGGSCVLQYATAQTNNYSARSIAVMISVTTPSQTVNWTTLPNLAINSSATLGVTSGYPLATGETSTGSGAITYSVSSCSAFSITAAGVITPRATGPCAITATQAATSTFSAGSKVETLTIVAAVPDAPTINSVSASGGSTPTSGAVTVNFTDNGENGASITKFVLKAQPSGGAAIYDTETVGAGTRSGTISGLTLGTAYTISVYAINSAGNSTATTYSTSVTPAGAPYAVTGLSATPGNGSLSITYVQPASLNGGTWTQYQYFITPAGTAFSDTPTATDPTQAHQSYTFTGLTNGQSYNIKVVAITTANGSPTTANTTLLNMIPAISPNTPSLSITQTSATAVSISWASLGDGGSAITGYTITVTKNGAAQSCYTNLSTTNCSLTGLSGLDAISASATATNLIGTSASVSANYTVIGVAATPTGLTIAAGDTFLTITFTQPNSGDAITGYQYTFDGSTFNDAGTNSSPIILAGLTNDTPYTINIRAIGALYGASLLSASVSETPTAGAVPPPPPPPPSSDSGVSVYVANNQAASITSALPPFGYSDTITLLIVSGIFPDSVTSISVSTAQLDKSLWAQSATRITITMMPHAVDTVSIQIYNGQIPLLGAISFAYIARPIAPATPITTPPVPTTDTATAGMMDDQLPQSPSVVALRLSVPYRPNSYFLNLKARAAIAKIAAKYKKANLDRIVITGFVSPGPKNPYPKYLGAAGNCGEEIPASLWPQSDDPSEIWRLL